MEATVKLDQDMTFLATANSGFTVKMDSSKSVGGNDAGPRPMELMLMSLGGCTGMDVISILRKMRQDITSFELELDADQAGEHPRVFTHITVKYIVRGHQINPKLLEKAITLSKTRYCPAQAMLEKGVTIDHTYEIIEEVPETEIPEESLQPDMA